MILTRAISNSASYTPRTLEQVFFDLLKVSTGSVTENTAIQLGAVAAAHRIYTNALACMPWMIRQKVGEDRLENPHALSSVLKVRTNSYMSPYTFMKWLSSRAFWYGTAFAWIIRKNGVVTEILPLPYTPAIKINPKDGVRWYEFTVPEDNLYGVKLTRKLTESELFIFRFESFDGVSGKGLLELAGEVIGGDLTAQKYTRKFYANGARPSGILEVSGDLSDEQRDMAKNEWQENYAGDNAFKVAVLDNGMKYTPIGISQEQQQYIEQRKFTVEEIARYSGIPEYMLQTGKQSYNSNEQQELDFLKSTLIPPVTQLEQEGDYKLFSETDVAAGWYLKLNTTSRLRGTDKERSEFYEKMIGLGVYDQDEARALEDRSPLPDGIGKKYWMSKNYAPIDATEAFIKTPAAQEGGKSK